ncbi:hypothetical protein Tco_0230743 [Tanacetum coccineum]
MELHVVSYGIDSIVRPLLLFFSFEIDFYSLVRYGVSNGLDTAYWKFLGVRTTFDIFQNIHILYLKYGVLDSSGYGVLIFFPCVVFGECRHGYAVSSLMDTEYWSSE